MKWMTTPDGRRALVLPAHFATDHSEGIEGYDCLVVHLTKPTVRGLLAKMNAVTAWHAQDNDVEAVEYYDRTDAEWWPNDFDAELEDDIRPYWDGRGDFDSRTDRDRIVVSTEYVWWIADTKHTDARVESDGLDRVTLERLLQEAPDAEEHDPARP